MTRQRRIVLGFVLVVLGLVLAGIAHPTPRERWKRWRAGWRRLTLMQGEALPTRAGGRLLAFRDIDMDLPPVLARDLEAALEGRRETHFVLAERVPGWLVEPTNRVIEPASREGDYTRAQPLDATSGVVLSITTEARADFVRAFVLMADEQERRVLSRSWEMESRQRLEERFGAEHVHGGAPAVWTHPVRTRVRYVVDMRHGWRAIFLLLEEDVVKVP